MEKYRSVSQIGKGSYGYALLVRNIEEKDALYAMKVIDLSSMSEKNRADSINEMAVLKALDCPFIIKYKEAFFQKNTHLCIVMDYADGGDLYAFIGAHKSGKASIPEATVGDIFAQVCLAVEHVHSRKTLHRDLKTQNVFLTKNMQVQLGDFGVAKVLQHTYDLAKTAIGTPYYLSPEICQEQPYNQKSDIWSLGCILYEMLSLNHAFDSFSMKGLILKILQGNFPAPPPQYSKEIVALLKSLLNTDPDQRPSIAEVLEHPAVRARAAKFRKMYPDHYPPSAPAKVPEKNSSLGRGASKSPTPAKPLDPRSNASLILQKSHASSDPRVGEQEQKSNKLMPIPNFKKKTVSEEDTPAPAKNPNKEWIAENYFSNHSAHSSSKSVAPVSKSLIMSKDPPRSQKTDETRTSRASISNVRDRRHSAVSVGKSSKPTPSKTPEFASRPKPGSSNASSLKKPDSPKQRPSQKSTKNSFLGSGSSVSRAKSPRKPEVLQDPPLKSDVLFRDLKINVDKQDTLAFKVEALRMFLEKKLGLEKLLKIYREMRGGEAKDAPEPAESHQGDFEWLIVELIFLEDLAFKN